MVMMFLGLKITMSFKQIMWPKFFISIVASLLVILGCFRYSLHLLVTCPIMTFLFKKKCITRVAPASATAPAAASTHFGRTGAATATGVADADIFCLPNFGGRNDAASAAPVWPKCGWGDWGRRRRPTQHSCISIWRQQWSWFTQKNCITTYKSVLLDATQTTFHFNQ